MSQCLNPNCLNPNPLNHNFCQKCGSTLLLTNRYRALKIIGQGGFGRTFLAVDEFKPSKPFCVIKQFLPQDQGTNTLNKASELFEEEAKRLDELGKHPQIPELMAYFISDNRQYLIQQFIEGQNLQQELEKGVFNQIQIKELLINILTVLKFVHENHVIHRDIKPENIIMRSPLTTTSTGSVHPLNKGGTSQQTPPFLRGAGGDQNSLVLVDFGASKVVQNTKLSAVGTVIGTAEYTATEQLAGKARYASDLYSLGVTCIHLLTNISPFDLYDTYEGEWFWRNFLNNNQVDDYLGKIIDKLIEPKPKDRYQNVDEVLADLGVNQGSIISPDTDFSNEQIQENQSVKQQIAGLQTFNFETVKVKLEYTTAWGTKTALVKQEKSKGSAQYYQEKLPNNIGLEMVYIQGGSFIMGSPPEELNSSDNERPQHLVTLQPFFMGKYPITQAQWKAVANMPKIALDLKPDPSNFKGNDRPVENVNWLEAIEFCQRLSRHTGKIYTLPSESQWEYACRATPLNKGGKGGSIREEDLIKEWNQKYHQPFYFGENITPELVNYDGNNPYGDALKGEYRQQTTKVGQFPPNNFGLYDMHGNIWEWCLDNYQEDYNNYPKNGSAYINDSGDKVRMLRGGSWDLYSKHCRSAYRNRFVSGFFFNYIGFRVFCAS
jgi:formylglycine-generating enzyme required for sulfatase activity